MAKYRKLSRTSSQRKALLRGQVTALLNNGKIVKLIISAIIMIKQIITSDAKATLFLLIFFI